MAEGPLGSILGEEDERPESEATGAPPSVDAFAAAVAARLAASDPEVARETSAFLKKQAQLVETQNEHLIDEHAVRLATLHDQRREGALRRTGIRIRIAFQLLAVVIAGFVGVAAIMMIRDALASRSVIIEAFDIAPNLSARVPSGKIVAAGLLDVLTRIQSETRANAAFRDLSSAWTNDIGIELPETGVSIGEIQRLLNARLGHDQHIDGDLTEAEDGNLALTVRGAGIYPKTFSDPQRRLDTLLTQAGEYLYGQSQPALWVAHLDISGRYDEAISFSQSAYPSAPASERPYLLNAWASAVGSKGGEAEQRESLALYREALRLKPDYWIAYTNIMFELSTLGEEEEVVSLTKQMLEAAGGRPGRAPEITYSNYDSITWDLRSQHASGLADMEAHSGIGTSRNDLQASNLNIASLDVQMHDVGAATVRLQMTQVDTTNVVNRAALALLKAQLAEEAGDARSAVGQWDTYMAAYRDDVNVRNGNPGNPCFGAMSYERTGQAAKADAAFAAVGDLTLVDCDRLRGDVLDSRGDWPGALASYAKAVKLAPSLPAGYYSWGMALAKHGDLEGAATKLALAHQTGPHWADPLKAWGDVLVRQGHNRDACSKYDEALEYAPNWTALKVAREKAAGG